ncbi:hypothetical protein CONLIGDRAFT_1988 [Coniochaeta ligniaria NRRL 30616]|uniref:Uncharacterized protein n=1 Tax=Coniochaeta ligniaria NRRL 30616 TaxID=1408157 RepID=A0A1J7J2N1_9PEZI|nr:hypothetical protein CONLIGDRAFT_1988 [Coniochaeta ligniaria NRRL 30616]
MTLDSFHLRLQLVSRLLLLVFVHGCTDVSLPTWPVSIGSNAPGFREVYLLLETNEKGESVFVVIKVKGWDADKGAWVTVMMENTVSTSQEEPSCKSKALMVDHGKVQVDLEF